MSTERDIYEIAFPSLGDLGKLVCKTAKMKTLNAVLDPNMPDGTEKTGFQPGLFAHISEKESMDSQDRALADDKIAALFSGNAQNALYETLLNKLNKTK